MHILEVKELVRDYSIISEDKKERTQIRVLKGLIFSVEAGEFVRSETGWCRLTLEDARSDPPSYVRKCLA